jgi:hypothetical protein
VLLTHKQIFDGLSYSVRNADAQPIMSTMRS